MLPETSRLLDFWRAKCNGRDIPDRSDFRAEEFGPWMGHLAICGVENDPQRFKLRLIGTAIRDLDGRDYTGHYLDEVLEEPLRHYVIAQWALGVSRRQPVLINYVWASGPQGQGDMEKLFLPMSVGSNAVRQVLAYVRVRRGTRAGIRWPTLQEMERDGSSSVTVID